MWNKLTRHHAVMYVLTFCCYMIYHASRRAFSNTKDSLSKEWSPIPCNSSWPCLDPYKTWRSHGLFLDYDAAEPFLGSMDAVFMFSYAIGLYISGVIGDRFELRLVLAIGMWISSVMMFVFGTLSEWLHLYSRTYYLILWGLNGFVQSTGWPCVVSIVGNWFGKSGRGLLFGVWSSCASVGNIVGSLMAGALVVYGYEVVFLNASMILFGGGCLAFFGIINSPVDIGYPDPNAISSAPLTDADPGPSTSHDRSSIDDANSVDDVDETSFLLNSAKSKPIGFLRALLLPGVITYALVFATIKLVNYSLSLWLPYYLTNNFGWSDASAANLSVWFDVGSIIGGILFGFLSDLSGKRSPVLALMILISPVAIWGYSMSPPDKTINSVLLLVVGVFVGGICNIIGTTVTTDLGKQEVIGSNTDALATVTGIVDGTGNIGSGVGQFLVPYIQSRGGWKWVFYSFMMECSLVFICLIPALVRDLKTWPPMIKFRNYWKSINGGSVTD